MTVSISMQCHKLMKGAIEALAGRIIVVLALAVAGLMSVPASGQNVGKFPPVESIWKLEEGVTSFDMEFKVKSRSVYIFTISFRSDASSDEGAVRSFLGDGSYKFTVDKSFDSRMLMPGIDGSLTELHRRANKGEIVRQSADPGTIVSVKFSVEGLDAREMIVAPRIVDTKGIDGYRAGAKFRVVAEETLEPGRYRVRSFAQSMPAFPKGLSTSFAVLPPRQY